MSNFNVSVLQQWPILRIVDRELITQVRMAAVFGGSGNEAIIVTKDDKVYALGSNKGGCLGIGTQINTPYPIEVATLSGKGVTKFAYSITDTPHVLALTEAGKVYSWGKGEVHSQFVQGTQYTPVEIMDDLRDKIVIDIACFDDLCVASTTKGEVYIWGYFAGERFFIEPRQYSSTMVDEKIISFGLPDNLYHTIRFNWDLFYVTSKKIDVFGEPVKVVSGSTRSTHTMVLTQEGSLYTWGNNDHGQLGNGGKDSTCSPHMIPSALMGGRVVDIAAGRYVPVSAALNERGQAFMWGKCREQEFLIPTLTTFSSVQEVLWYANTTGSMDYALVLSEKGASSFVESMKRGFDDPISSDLAIQVQGKRIHVHKAILQLRSTYFQKMFEGDWAEKTQSVIEHEQFSYEVYRAFLQYLYTDEVQIALEKTSELLRLADQYEETRLVELCNRIIEKNRRLASGPSPYNPPFVKRGNIIGWNWRVAAFAVYHFSIVFILIKLYR